MAIGTQACPRCETSVAEDARFCPNCGQSLAVVPPAGDVDQTRLSASAPAPLIEKMQAARMTGERKPVTALFADIVGSTTLAEQMDPEDWTQVINEAFELMSGAVFRYEGTIAQLQGDAMLAFFGAPVAHEDDPTRAILAALAMIEATDEFARQLKQTHGIDFRIRAGINTGPVVVGNVGTDLRYEYTALGDAVNVAARMQTAAQPGTVLVTDSTYRLADAAFDAVDLGEIEVKGKSEPVHVYRVLARREASVSRRGLAGVGLESPMIGRDAALETVRSLLEVVRAGRGRVGFVVGEPGIGKSRLLAELKRSEARDHADPVTWLEGRCVSYGRNVPYLLLIDLVRATLGIPLNASETDARRILDDELARWLDQEGADTVPYLAHLLSLPLRADEADRAKLDPDVLQGRYAVAIYRLIRHIAEAAPVVLVCEDIHWADAASIEVLRQLLPILVQHKVLFLGVLRAETDSGGWALMSQAREVFGAAMTEVRLEPLTEAESRELVAHLLEIESLPSEVRDTILARAEGNPFFVEEVVRMLIERGVIERTDRRWVASAGASTVEIPETLHGLLLARIDQLPESAKRSLRVASVIGRQFPVRVLDSVLAAPER
jgi:class 3 adenylate cyclase